MDVLRLALAVGLPWATGMTVLMALQRRRARLGMGELFAYGHLTGILLLTMLMRATSAIGLQWSFGLLSSLLAVVIAISGGAYVAARRKTGLSDEAASASTRAAWTWLAALAGLLLLVRLGTLAYEAMMRPLYPWDAWTQWATKAKVWSSLHGMAPFIDYGQWLARVPGYTDTAPGYPATVPLLQAWVALALGRFDDVLVNVSWVALALALAVGIRAQLAALSMSPAWALFTAYAALSLPLLDTHVALAGYADLYVSASFALGLLAVMRWERGQDRMQIVYVAVAIALLPTLKVPGAIWAAILGLGVAAAAFGRSFGRFVLVFAVAAGVAGVVAVTFLKSKLASLAGPVKVEVAQPFIENLFLFDNWHLLWYLLPIAVALGWRNAVSRMRGASAALIAGALFLAATFLLTRAASWVADYTTVNRAILHIAPAALVFGAMLAWDWSLGRNAIDNATQVNMLEGPAA